MNREEPRTCRELDVPGNCQVETDGEYGIQRVCSEIRGVSHRSPQGTHRDSEGQSITES